MCIELLRVYDIVYFLQFLMRNMIKIMGKLFDLKLPQSIVL